MKKSTTKLALKTQTVRLLNRTELDGAQGGTLTILSPLFGGGDRAGSNSGAFSCQAGCAG